MAHPNEALSMRQNFAGADVRTVPGGKEIAEQESGFTRLLENGIARRVYWAKAPLTGWKVAMSIPGNRDYGFGKATGGADGVVAGLAVILLVLVVWIVARRLTEPVRRLTLAAEHVSQQRYETAGDLEAVAGRRDELGQLARTFRNMVGEIASREATLRSAEEKLRQSELHYRSLIENTSDIIALIDKEGRFKYASPSIVRILGVETEAAAGALGDFLDDKGKLALGRSDPALRVGLGRVGTGGSGRAAFQRSDPDPGSLAAQHDGQPRGERHRRKHPRHHRAHGGRPI